MSVNSLNSSYKYPLAQESNSASTQNPLGLQYPESSGTPAPFQLGHSSPKSFLLQLLISGTRARFSGTRCFTPGRSHLNAALTVVVHLFSLLCSTPSRDYTTVVKYCSDEQLHMPCIYFHFYFLTGSHCIAQTGFEFTVIPLPQLSECCDYMSASSCLASICFILLD